MIELLQELLRAYGPCGEEDAVREICLRELAPLVDSAWVDRAGNVIGRVSSSSRNEEHSPVRVMAHMDELSMLVKRVQSDGIVRLTPLGTMYPGNFGLGPVMMLGEREHVCGVLTVGSEHTTQESPHIWQTKPDGGDRALNWSDVYVFSGRTSAELAEAGIRPGTRVCVHRSKRELVEIDDYLGSYFMDDRAPLVVLLSAARKLKERAQRPPQDVYFVCTVSEEVGGLGGSYASRALPGELTLALEVGPTEAEYGTTVTGGPIVGYSDAQCIYDKAVADRLMEVATTLGTDPQPAVLGAFESDASHAKSNGHAATAGLLCLPTLSTHGYEVVPRDGISALSAVLVEFLMNPNAVCREPSGVNNSAESARS